MQFHLLFTFDMLPALAFKLPQNFFILFVSSRDRALGYWRALLTFRRTSYHI